MTHNDAATTDKDPDDFDAWLWSAAPQAVDSSVDTPASAVQQPPPVTPLITETVTPPTAEYPSLSLLTSPAEIATWDDDAVYPPAESLMVDLPDDTLILTAVEFSDYGIEEIDENFGDTLELDPTFAAQIAATTQQDYSRRAGLLTTRLIATYEWQGGITYRELMFALRTLNRNISALQQLCIGLAAADVRVKRAPYLYNFNRIPIEDRVLIQTVFHPILVHHIAPEAAIRRLGYANVRLSKADRALLVDALERHQLSRSEERELFTEIARLGGSGIAAARPHVHQLINDNLWMVARIVRLYLGRGVPFADLFQEGVLGLYRAIDRFDLETGHRFMKYGGIWVRQVIMRAISDKARLIRLPVHVGERVQVLERTTLELEQGLQRTPTTTELAAALGTTPKRVGNLLRIIDPPLSLEGDGADLIDTLADSDPATDPEAAALQQTLCAAVCAMLALLPDRERRIIELRYGLLDDWDRTFEEVGQQIGVTRERIRQLEEKILRKLGSPLFGTHELERAWLKDSPAVNSTDTETHTKRRRSKKPAPADDPTDLKSCAITSEVTDGNSPAPGADASLESKTHQLPSITLEREESSPANQLCDDVVAWQESSFGTETVAGQPAVTSLPIKRGRCKPRRNH